MAETNKIIITNECLEDAIGLMHEYTQIHESDLRKKLIDKGHIPCRVEAAIKQLKEEYVDVQSYPIVAVIDYTLIWHGGLDSATEDTDDT